MQIIGNELTEEVIREIEYPVFFCYSIISKRKTVIK